jgi:glycosyltransferase involved in cell wall biosynthesis
VSGRSPATSVSRRERDATGCLRIALFITSMWGGGAERVAATLVRLWSDAGHDVVVVTALARSPADYELPGNVRRIALDLSRRSRTGTVTSGAWRVIGWARQFRRVLHRERPDLVVSFLVETNVPALLASVGVRVPVIVSERVHPSAVNIRWRLARPFIYRLAAALVVPSDEMRSWAQRLVGGRRAWVVQNPIGIESLKQARRSDRSRRRVVAMGRVVPQKGFDLLLDAFGRCANAQPAWDLVVYGDGFDRRELQALALRMGLGDRVTFAGHADDAAAAFVEGDLFVLSSRWEAFPNVLAEAMACALPAIAFDCRFGPRSIIRPGVDGVLVRDGDVDALAEAMLALMNDDGMRRRFAERAVEVCSRFSPEAIGIVWDGVVSSVLSAPPVLVELVMESRTKHVRASQIPRRRRSVQTNPRSGSSRRARRRTRRLTSPADSDGRQGGVRGARDQGVQR